MVRQLVTLGLLLLLLQVTSVLCDKTRSTPTTVVAAVVMTMLRHSNLLGVHSLAVLTGSPCFSLLIVVGMAKLVSSNLFCLVIRFELAGVFQGKEGRIFR